MSTKYRAIFNMNWKAFFRHQMTEEEKEAAVARQYELLEMTRPRNRGVPTNVLEREVREVVSEVRRRDKESRSRS